MDGTYTYVGDQEGKPKFAQTGGENFLYWKLAVGDAGAWRIGLGAPTPAEYQAEGDVAFPWDGTLVWNCQGGLMDPPTVTQAPA